MRGGDPGGPSSMMIDGGIPGEPGRTRNETEAGVERTHRNRGDLSDTETHDHLLCDDGEDAMTLWRINV